MARRNIDRGDPFGFLGSTGLKVLENPSLANEMLEEVHKSEKNAKKCGVLCDAEIWKSVAGPTKGTNLGFVGACEAVEGEAF